MQWANVPAMAVVDIEGMTALVEHLDDSAFDSALLDLMSSAGVVAQEASGIAISGTAAPVAVGWRGRRADSGLRAQALARQFFQADPMLRRLPAREGMQRSSVSAVRASAIDDDAYRWLCFDAPGFRQRVTVARSEMGGWRLFSLFFDDVLNDDQVRQVAALSVLAFPIIRRHKGWQAATAERATAADPVARLVDLLGSRYPSLTQRERHVCALTALGKDSAVIADRLAITRNTVLTYRRRAYERLGVSSASALMAELV